VKAVIFTLRSLSKQIRWEQLADLRHKSIVAHGYAGVSAEDIREAAQMPAGELLDKLRGALQSLDVPVAAESNPYATGKRFRIQQSRWGPDLPGSSVKEL
jgi:hypothetical protein